MTVPLFAVLGLAMLASAAVLISLAVRAGITGADLWGTGVLAVLSVPTLAFARLIAPAA